VLASALTALAAGSTGARAQATPPSPSSGHAPASPIAFSPPAASPPARAPADTARDSTRDAPRPRLEARRLAGRLVLDGHLDEPAWRDAPVAAGFRTVEPTEGAPTAFPTAVRVLHDDHALYVGVFCRDALGARGVRVQDLRRKFDDEENDLFGVGLDALHDGRTVAAFQVTPYGAQNELQIFDDAVYNREWEAVWRVRTVRSDSGWTAEIEIPWATLRYRADGEPWGVSFWRVARRANEISAWAPWPREFSPYRASYYGRLVGVRPPAPRGGPVAGKLRLRPYVLAQRATAQEATGGAPPAPGPDGAQVLTEPAGRRARVGGEVTWTPTPNTAVDLTANTDFAQADVDRQVVNTTRFDVFFPERRQFFLEGASLFDVGPTELPVKPFFSRRVGLDAAGLPVPIQWGARAVRRDASGGDGLLVMRQGAGPRPGEDAGATTFALARVSRNLGQSGRLGVLAAGRDAGAGAARFAGTDTARRVARARDAVVAVDGFARVGDAVQLDGMVSAASAAAGGRPGVAAYGSVARATNALSAAADVYLVTRDYDPPTGFVARRDIVRTAANASYDWRPRGRPAAVRNFFPFVGTQLYGGAADRRLQETFTELWADVVFQNGALVYPQVTHHYQRLTAPFAPVRGVAVAPGVYQYWRWEAGARTDQSAPYGGSAELSTGGYFDRRLDRLALAGRLAPTPARGVRAGLRGKPVHRRAARRVRPASGRRDHAPRRARAPARPQPAPAGDGLLAVQHRRGTRRAQRALRVGVRAALLRVPRDQRRARRGAGRAPGGRPGGAPGGAQGRVAARAVMPPAARPRRDAPSAAFPTGLLIDVLTRAAPPARPPRRSRPTRRT
jgi:hypothetical protein